MWQGEVIVDYDQHVFYVLGTGGTLEDAMNGRGVEKIYTMDVHSGDLLDSHPLGSLGTMSDRVIDGKILAFRWNETDTVEEMVRIDPSTGVITGYGTVGDLYWWSGVAPLNVANRECYAFGMNGAPPGTGETKMYIMDTVTGELLDDFPVINDPGIAVLVY